MTSNPFATILVGGPDARTFLQGQLTCDMDELNEDRSLLACVNSAQGRVQATLAVRSVDGVALTVLASMAERTLQRLKKYVLRSKVKFEIVDAREFAGHESLADCLRVGIPHVFPETHEAFVAQMLNLDVLGGISFEKGCYTGQEIIARAHFRGTVKRRMFRFESDCPAPAPGTRITTSGNHAGDVVYSTATVRGCELLAVVNLSHSSDELRIDDKFELKRLELPYTVPF
jgi:tRNA-modifying protein YgfZ